MSYLATENISIEVGSITFTDSDSGTLAFELPFLDDSYQVVVAIRDTGDAGGVNVNIYIDSVNSSKREVVVKASAKFTGIVDVIAVKTG